MATVLKFILQTLFGWWLGHEKRRAIHQVKAQGIQTYLKVLQGVRLSVIGILTVLIVLQFLTLGFLLMVGAGIYLAPLETEVKLWLIFGCGAFFFLAPLIVLWVLLSERLWYRLSGAQNLVSELLEPKP